MAEWRQKYGLIRPLRADEEEAFFVVPMGDRVTAKCSVCGDPARDHCSNCNVPLCKDHDVLYVTMARPDGFSLFVLGFCKECVDAYHIRHWVAFDKNINKKTGELNFLRMVNIYYFLDEGYEHNDCLHIMPDGTVNP